MSTLRRFIPLALVAAVSTVAVVLLSGGGPRDSGRPTVLPRGARLASTAAAPTVGEVLTTTNGTWTNGPTSFAYQWQRCAGASCTSISGATATSYTVATADVGDTIRVVVTASNAGGSASQTSVATGVVTAGGGGGGGCAATASSVAAIQSAVAAAADGATICVAAGSYGAVTLQRSGSPATYVTVEPVLGSDPNGAGKVTFTGEVSLYGPFVKLRDVYTTAGIRLPEDFQGGAARDVIVDHSDVSGQNAGEAIYSEGCSRGPNATIPYTNCNGGYTAVDHVTISGNRIHTCGGNGGAVATGCEDLIHLNNDHHVTITGNNMYDLWENGAHNDYVQNVWGGSNLTIDHNYMHTGHGEGWILKDGDMVSTTITDNLVTRILLPDPNDPNPKTSWVVNTHGSVLRNNTMWGNNTQPVQITSDTKAPTSCSPSPPYTDYCSTAMYDTTFDHNVLEQITNSCCGLFVTTIDSEGFNIWKQAPGTFAPAASDSLQSNPAFKCASACGSGTLAGDDLELATNPNGIGIDWNPAAQAYGPQSPVT